MILYTISIILLVTLIIWQIYQSIHSKNTFNKLWSICAGGKNKQLGDKLDTNISSHEDIAIGEELLDISIIREKWNHYISFTICAGEDSIPVATYIYNTRAKDINRYTKMSNRREANAILKCMFRVLNARIKNRHVNLGKIGKKQGTEVLGHKEA